MLTPAYIAALVARSHGQVILDKRDLADAALLKVEVTENDRGEVVIRTSKHVDCRHRPDRSGDSVEDLGREAEATEVERAL